MLHSIWYDCLVTKRLAFVVCSPEKMLEELRQRPSLKVLEDLNLCLAYRSTTWLQVYCRLGGVAMQLEVRGDLGCIALPCQSAQEAHRFAALQHSTSAATPNAARRSSENLNT